jgi:hypothetical protein
VGLFLRGKVWWLKRTVDGVEWRWSMRTRDELVARMRAPSYERFLVTCEALRHDPVLRRLLREHLGHERAGWLYFIVDDDADCIKIGFSRNVAQRLKHAQIHCARRLRLLRKVRRAPAAEREWHARFAHLRVRGEWYRRTDGLLAAIRDA